MSCARMAISFIITVFLWLLIIWVNKIILYIEAGINWRHIDRIHYYDSDTIEGSVTVVF